MIVSIVFFFFSFLANDIRNGAYSRINLGTIDTIATLLIRTLMNGFWGGLLLLVVWVPLYWFIFLRKRIYHELRTLSIRSEERRVAIDTLDLVRNLMSEQARQFTRLAELQDTVVRFGKDSLYLRE
jgi:hypothetical protein